MFICWPSPAAGALRITRLRVWLRHPSGRRQRAVLLVTRATVATRTATAPGAPGRALRARATIVFGASGVLESWAPHHWRGGHRGRPRPDADDAVGGLGSLEKP